MHLTDEMQPTATNNNNNKQTAINQASNAKSSSTVQQASRHDDRPTRRDSPAAGDDEGPNNKAQHGKQEPPPLPTNKPRCHATTEDTHGIKSPTLHARSVPFPLCLLRSVFLPMNECCNVRHHAKAIDCNRYGETYTYAYVYMYKHSNMCTCINIHVCICQGAARGGGQSIHGSSSYR